MAVKVSAWELPGKWEDICSLLLTFDPGPRPQGLFSLSLARGSEKRDPGKKVERRFNVMIVLRDDSAASWRLMHNRYSRNKSVFQKNFILSSLAHFFTR